MKTSIAVRIVLYSVLILILCGMLISGIWGHGFGLFGLNFGTFYDDSSYISTDGKITVDSSTINKVEVEWISGDIYINGLTNGSDIIFLADKAENDRHNMQYRVKNGVLSIKFCKPQFLMGNVPDKDLYITLPANKTLKELDIECVSSDIVGDSNWTLKADTVKIENVSGKTDLWLRSNYIDCETVSGKLSIAAENCLKDGSFESVSADIDLTFMPAQDVDNFGFAAEFDSVSGDIRCEYDSTIFDDNVVHGTPTCELEFDTVSGDVNIKKMK